MIKNYIVDGVKYSINIEECTIEIIGNDSIGHYWDHLPHTVVKLVDSLAKKAELVELKTEQQRLDNFVAAQLSARMSEIDIKRAIDTAVKTINLLNKIEVE